MRKIGFDQRMRTGFPEIDQQKARFIELLVGMMDQFAAGKAPGDLQEPLRYLEEHLERHFRTEEKAMNTLNYPQLDYHRAQHEEFIRSFHNIRAAFHTHPNELDRQNLHHFIHWLINHFQEEDHRMAEFFRRLSR